MSNERERELLKAETDRWWSFRESSIKHSKEYGISTIRSLILINGAAIIAVLTFISNLKKDSTANVDFQQLKYSISAFVVGLLLAILAGAFGYFNFQSNALMVPDPNQLHRDVTSKKLNRRKSNVIRHTAYAAVAVVGASFLSFAVGSFFALSALTSK